jgi:hypothetical protein
MIAISVSTNYDDLLAIILPQNYKFFDKWYIVTRPDDEKTINVVKSANYPNVELVFFNFFAPLNISRVEYRRRTLMKKPRLVHITEVVTPKFNKGGAIRMCQQKLINEGYTGSVLLLDSDIYLPDNFTEIIGTIRDNTLYGTEKRSDYYSLNAFQKKVPDNIYPGSQQFHGYFQLYKQTPAYLYKDSGNCSTCDMEFIDLFKQKQVITNLCVDHLGKPGINWDMRLTHDDFKSD